MRAILVPATCAAVLLAGVAHADVDVRKDGSSWGSASHCCGCHGGKRAVAALLAFFSSDFF